VSKETEITFMQVRLLRIAIEELHKPMQEVLELFNHYNIFNLIDNCYEIFHVEGDYAIFEEITSVLKCKGAIK
jgi:hypothetical protein